MIRIFAIIAVLYCLASATNHALHDRWVRCERVSNTAAVYGLVLAITPRRGGR